MASSADARHRGALAPVGPAAPRRVLVIATDALEDVGLIDELADGRRPDELEVALVAPVVEQSAVKHAAGDLEPAREHAERRLEARLAELRRGGVSAFGMLGDTDPLLAAEDALKSFPAEEVLIFERPGEQSRWFEDGLFEHSQARLEPPIRMVTVEARPGRAVPVAEERAGRGTVEAGRGERQVGLAPYLPSFEAGDLSAIAIGVFGTLVAIIFFAAGPGTESAAGVAAALIALAAGLINLAHVIALTLFESVRYRGGFRRFVRAITLIYTPLAVVANVVLWLAS
jgi:hypothetical protein